MRASLKKKKISLYKRRLRSKKNLRVVADRPRMVVFRSAKYLYVQVYDVNNRIIVSTSSLTMRKSDSMSTYNNIGVAKLLGSEIGKNLKSLGIKKIVFDRNGYLYHGKIKALADSCRESGIDF